MRRSKNRSMNPRPRDDGHLPGAYQIEGRAPGQLPVWARIRSFHRRSSSSAIRHQSLASPSEEGPELTELSSSRSVLMGEDNDPSRLPLVPIPDTPLDPPYESWRDNVDIPSQADSQQYSDQAVRRSTSSDETTDYSLPPELRAVRHQSTSSSSSDALPREASLPRISGQVAAPPTEHEHESSDDFVSSGSEFLNWESSKFKRRRTCIYIFAILIGVGIGVGVGVSQRKENDASSDKRGRSSEPAKCNYSANQTTMPNVFVQCECDGVVTMWNDETEAQYYSLRENFMPAILPDFDAEDEGSCDPTNSALWQLSSDTLLGANATDTRYLLTLLYANWDGEGWRKGGDWLSITIPECQWTGIECNIGEQVRSISLEDNNLGGTIPTEIALLTSLRSIALASNRLSGTLPAELFQLARLERLRLSMNFLDGTVPKEVALLPFLELLQLDFNYFSGTIPLQMGFMFSLKLLDIGDNKLTGTIPPELGRLSRLEGLKFDRNALSGTLPSSLGSLGRLRSLIGGRNLFRGKLLSELGILNELRSLDFDGAGFAGEIPTELGRNTNLSILSLADNNFVGQLPPELFNLTNLAYLHLSRNGLSGTIPARVGTLSKLSVLELDKNFYVGMVPSELGLLSLLAKLNLGGLDLSGSVPQAVCDLREGALDVFIAPCSDGSGVVPNTFQCSVPVCCTDCVT